MYVKCAVETILSSFLLLSRVWARPSDVVCDGGRGEGDKWFDGCRWCVCQRSGPLCSSAECSHLVARVSPCQKVDSRWWDGCYHCKCYRHGIECTANETCVMLLRSERFRADFLSRGACVNPKDDRCVCGIDGVPSCTAAVIDRNAYPAITIGLNPVFPSSNSLVFPKVVYYERPFKKYDKVGASIQRPEHYTDASYLHYDVTDKSSAEEQQLQRHSLVKRQTYNRRRHSPEFHHNRRHVPQIPGYEPAVKTPISISHARRNSRNPLTTSENNIDRLGSPVIKTFKRPKTLESRNSDTNVGEGQFNNKKRRRECTHFHDNNSISNVRDTQKYARAEDENKRQTDPQADVRIKRRLKGQARSKRFKDCPEEPNVQMLDEMFPNDEPSSGRKPNNSSQSLLIASDNRCRWGVRWYGGSLRCYCDIDNSITCGEPSFVASRIDGFRLERAPCEKGQIWEEDDSCRSCECQINGVGLCRRSPSCPLPFLIKPIPVDLDDGIDLDRKEFSIGEKDQHSESLTDEFTGREEHKVDWDKPKVDTTPMSVETDHRETIEDKDEEVDKDIYVESNSISNGDIPDEIDGQHTLQSKERDKTDDWKRSSSSGGESSSDNPDVNVISLYDGPTSGTYVVIKPKDNPGNESINNSVEKESSNDKDIHISDNKTDKENKKANDLEKNESKRNSQVVVVECKPKSRWLDGCKRCECDQAGRKYCDESRCLKPMPVVVDITSTSAGTGDRRPFRPVQRPPETSILSRDGPVNLDPPYLATSSCGRFTLGQQYWDECNMCVCTSHGPKCTAKNCV